MSRDDGPKPGNASSDRDYSLKSGERQFAPHLAGIRGDHRNRYAYGLAYLPNAGFGLDVFCGNGYGTYMAAVAGIHMLGIDASPDAIALATERYRTPRCFFARAEWPFDLPAERFDLCFCLESVEHVEDGAALVSALAGALRPGGRIVLSTPNQVLMPFVPAQHRFHVRHYTPEETFGLLEQAGLSLIAWGGQTVFTIHADGRHDLTRPDAPVETGVDGQFTIAVAEKVGNPPPSALSSA